MTVKCINFRANKKRQYRNKKFGFGGQKKRSKMNTKASARDMSDFKAQKHGMRPGKAKPNKVGVIKTL